MGALLSLFLVNLLPTIFRRAAIHLPESTHGRWDICKLTPNPKHNSPNIYLTQVTRHHPCLLQNEGHGAASHVTFYPNRSFQGVSLLCSPTLSNCAPTPNPVTSPRPKGGCGPGAAQNQGLGSAASPALTLDLSPGRRAPWPHENCLTLCVSVLGEDGEGGRGA